MTDAERPAGECVDRGAVAAAVVGEHTLDVDAMPLVEGDSAPRKPTTVTAFFVAEHLGVGETAVVVDGDVHVLPADCAAEASSAIGPARIHVLDTAGDAVPGAALYPAELFDVDVDQLARS